MKKQKSDGEGNPVEVLANKLRKLPKPRTDKDYSWKEPALNVLECVLSLHRNYNRVVEPRLNGFAERNPEVKSLKDLKGIISRLGKTEFLRQELDYDDQARAKTLLGVVKWLSKVQGSFEGATENKRLHSWAVQSKPADFERVHVKGFGLAGFQYLRMLFGAQTVKPDVHIRRFVCTAIGKVTDEQVVRYLELAAKKVNLPIRDVDAKIWQRGASRITRILSTEGQLKRRARCPALSGPG